MRARGFLIGLLLPLCACGVSDFPAVIGTGPGPDSTGTGQPFSAQYILSSVQPTPFVPSADAAATKSVIGQCVEIRPDGTMIQSILYTQDNPALETRETDAWSYVLSDSAIITQDPLGDPGITQQIGTVGGTSITITRFLRNDGQAVVRTLTFTKVAQLSVPCGT